MAFWKSPLIPHAVRLSFLRKRVPVTAPDTRWPKLARAIEMFLKRNWSFKISLGTSFKKDSLREDWSTNSSSCN